MVDLIPPTKLEYILRVQHAKNRQPSLDLGQAIRSALPGCTREEKLSVGSRLLALQNMPLANPSLKSSTVGEQQSSVVSDVVLKAAARAPLRKTKLANDLAFDEAAFRKILREEASGGEEA